MQLDKTIDTVIRRGFSHKGLEIYPCARTEQVMMAGVGPTYECWFVGPYIDPDVTDTRFWVTYRRHGGVTTIELHCQDTGDDAMLNSGALGTEKYHHMERPTTVDLAGRLAHPQAVADMDH